MLQIAQQANLREYGSVLQSDNDPSFESDVFQDAVRTIGLKHVRSKTNTSTSQAKVERVQQTVVRNMENELGEPARMWLQRSVADTNHFAVHGGVPTLVLGPQGGNTCKANEYVEVASMPAVARIYVQTALDLLGAVHPPAGS